MPLEDKIYVFPKIEKIGLFSFNMTIGLWEGKIGIQTSCTSLKN